MANLNVETPDFVLNIPKRGMPVTIITGFLGSGKTTLLNQILKNKQDLKIAVLVNEFGDINIDSQLLISTDDDMVELSNGCICCTINDGLLDAVYRVLEREDRIDYMVIETTGVADPLPIILTFVGTELRELTNLDSVLTVIDAETFTPEHFDSEAAFKQIVFGDIILLNKTDLATPEKVKELEDYIRTVKDGARILHSQHGEVPLPLILGLGLAEIDVYSEMSSENEHDHEHGHEHGHEYGREHGREHGHKHGHEHHHHHHSKHLENDGFISVSFQSDRPFSINKFQEFLTEKLPNDVFRAKGILWFVESDLRHLFQLSGKRFSLDGDDWGKSPSNQIVFIGRNLDLAKLQQQIAECIA